MGGSGGRQLSAEDFPSIAHTPVAGRGESRGATSQQQDPSTVCAAKAAADNATSCSSDPAPASLARNHRHKPNAPHHQRRHSRAAAPLSTPGAPPLCTDPTIMVAKFQILNPWADKDLIEAVLSCVAYDAKEAEKALLEMRFGGDSAAEGVSDAEAENHAAEEHNSSSDPPQWLVRIPPAPYIDEDTPREAMHAGNRRHRRAAALSRPKSMNDVNGCAGGSAADQCDQDALYRRHRGAAIKLTNKWRKAIRRAAAAFLAGDSSLVSYALYFACSSNSITLYAHCEKVFEVGSPFAFGAFMCSTHNLSMLA